VRNSGKIFHLPSMALALLARITPPDMEVSIVDEIIQSLNFDSAVDLVGITVNSKTVARSYEIGDEFRKRGVSVVMGGIHPTVCPQEAIEHADAVVIGESELVWNQLLEDFQKGNLQKFYKNHKYPDLQNYPIPQRELFPDNKYITTNIIQTSRGCPYNCSFCSVPSIYGTKVRLRSVDNVINEIKTLNGNEIIFVDDNIILNKNYAKQKS
ncbi:MAG: radical SAM protein, partial [bacterium]